MRERSIKRSDEEEEMTSGIIFNIQRYSIHDGPGIRTIVFLKGCPLRCQWCSNPESGEMSIQMIFSKKLCQDCGVCVQNCTQHAIAYDVEFGKRIEPSKCIRCGRCMENCPARAIQRIGKIVEVKDVVKEVLKDRIFYRKSGGGVTLSGGEPFFQSEFAAELLADLKANRISTAVETTGAVSFEKIMRSTDFVDLYLYDIKHMDSAVHRKYTGLPNEGIMENLLRLNQLGKRIWMRVPLIPQINDSEDNIERVYALANSLESVERVELLPYHEYGVGKYAQLGRTYTLPNLKKPDESKLSALLEIAAQKYPNLSVIVRRHA